jgi:hypothetical protein
MVTRNAIADMVDRRREDRLTLAGWPSTINFIIKLSNQPASLGNSHAPPVNQPRGARSFIGQIPMATISPSLTERYANIPHEMRTRKRWVCHRLEPKDGKFAKVPYALNGYHASCKKESDWTTFEEACAAVAARKFDGISYVLTGDDGPTCVDLDGVCAENGQVEPWAQEIIDTIDSYTERSQSGTGFHIFVRSSIPKGSHKKDSKVELYSNAKIIATTGDAVDLRFDIESRDITDLFTRAEAGEFAPQTTATPAPAPKNTGDASADDFALACRRARQFGCDDARALHAFLQQSSQDPKKLHRPDYAPRTVRAAIEKVRAASKPMVEAPPADWRTAFRDPATLQTGDVRMLIKGILPEGVTMFGSNSGVGKTWLAVSALKALITGDKYLGMFEVPAPQKVLYLVPEVGDRSLRYRLERMRVPLDGSLFRVRTLSDGTMHLNDPLLRAAVSEWNPVVFLDTAIRFSSAKDENSASENSPLADALFSLLKDGARAVVGLHHSLKGTAKAEELTLENVLRGTGDLGAMCDAVWGLQHDRGKETDGSQFVEESKNLTRLLVKCVKPRDFEPADVFRVQGRPYIDETGDFVILTGDNEAEGAVPASKAEKAASLVESDPRISKNKLARVVGCSRNSIDNLLASRGWAFMETSKTSGFWQRKATELGLERETF